MTYRVYQQLAYRRPANDLRNRSPGRFTTYTLGFGRIDVANLWVPSSKLAEFASESIFVRTDGVHGHEQPVTSPRLQPSLLRPKASPTNKAMDSAATASRARS